MANERHTKTHRKLTLTSSTKSSICQREYHTHEKLAGWYGRLKAPASPRQEAGVRHPRLTEPKETNKICLAWTEQGAAWPGD